MLNNETQKILNELTSISTTAIISYPKTGIQDIDRSILAFIDLSALGETEFEEFGLMNVNEFLSLISLIENPEITIENRIATIKGDGVESKYYTTDIDIIKEAYGTNPAIIDNINKAFEAANFELTKEMLDKIKKTSGFLRVNDLVISKGNSDDEIILNITDDSKSDSNSFKNSVIGTINDEELRLVIDMNNIKKIPSGDYVIKIAKNEKTGSYITKWSSLNNSCLEIVVSVKSY